MRLKQAIRKAALLLTAMLFVQVGANCSNDNNDSNNENPDKMEQILFVNGSPNRDGNTAALAKVLLEGRI